MACVTLADPAEHAVVTRVSQDVKVHRPPVATSGGCRRPTGRGWTLREGLEEGQSGYRSSGEAGHGQPHAACCGHHEGGDAEVFQDDWLGVGFLLACEMDAERGQCTDGPDEPRPAGRLRARLSSRSCRVGRSPLEHGAAAGES